jgi:hypothetical protein
VKVGDLVAYNRDEYNDRLGTHGIVVELEGTHVNPPIVTVLWNSKEFEKVFADELEVINDQVN